MRFLSVEHRGIEPLKGSAPHYVRECTFLCQSLKNGVRMGIPAFFYFCDVSSIIAIIFDVPQKKFSQSLVERLPTKETYCVISLLLASAKALI